MLAKETVNYNVEPMDPELPQEKMKILLIDDDSEMAQVIKNCLEFAYNCRIDIATDPFASMIAITEKFYDLVILDWNLSSLNGGQTLAESEKGLYFEPNIPCQWDIGPVPVVVFSSAEEPNCHFEGTKHFVNAGYISKRQSLSEVISSFGAYIRMRPRTSLGEA